jgi:uncharacterized protein (DUF2252 family)
MTLTTEERAAGGRRVRDALPLDLHGAWSPGPDRTDPLTILALQATTRLPDLVPIRYGRMAASPFAFYRGAAAVMAADLAGEPRSGLDVQLCGDAHLSNFGGFASPERDLIFDVNDFDETLPGPFEWDVKRLAASLEVMGRERGMPRKKRRATVMAATRSYREAMRHFGTLRNLEIWYSRLDAAWILQRWGTEIGKRTIGRFQRSAEKARSKDHLRAFAKLTREVDGQLEFVSDPPLLVPVGELFGEELADEVEKVISGSLRSYRRTLEGSRRALLSRYRFLDLARKVVGVGSVGTRCWVALLVGRDAGDPLFIQVKQAEASVLSPFLGPSRFSNQGQRVVEGQRLMQSSSDVFLGWDRVKLDADRDFYLRQLWDWKVSADVETMAPEILTIYSEMCGWSLANGHARSGDALAIGAYLGRGDRFDRAMAEFAAAYADQNERDHRNLVEAIKGGGVQAVTGL